MFRRNQENDSSQNNYKEKKKHIRIRPLLLGLALMGYTVFTLLDAFVIPRDIVTLESVQAAAANNSTAEVSSEPDAETNLRTDSGDAADSQTESAEDAGTMKESSGSADDKSTNDAGENASGKQKKAHADGKGGKPGHKHKPGRNNNAPGSGKENGSTESDSGSAGKSTDDDSTNNSGSGSKSTAAGSANSSATDSESAGTSEAAVVTSDSYQADGVTITLTEKRLYDTEVYIADIQLDDPSQLLSGLADNSFGRNLSEKTSEMASSLGAVLAVNGDYYGFRDSGYVMRNGYLYRSTARSGTGNEDLVIYSDGSMEIIDESEVTAEALAEKGAVQIYSFGPGLIDDGVVSVKEGDEVDQSMNSNPRTAIGMVEPGHYVMVVSDGRTDESAGLSLAELAEVMQDAGCTTAYNLDGGGSTTMWFNGEIVNNPTGGRGSNERAVSDIVYISK